jgi:hypothetical protein
MAVTHEHITAQVDRARVRRALRSHSRDELHERAVFWRIAVPGLLLFWVCVAYGIYNLT